MNCAVHFSIGFAIDRKTRQETKLRRSFSSVSLSSGICCSAEPSNPTQPLWNNGRSMSDRRRGRDHPSSADVTPKKPRKKRRFGKSTHLGPRHSNGSHSSSTSSLFAEGNVYRAVSKKKLSFAGSVDKVGCIHCLFNWININGCGMVF